MLGELTLQLAAFPERAWPRFAAADAVVVSALAVPRAASHAVLPSPLRHAVSVAFLSVLATCLGSTFRPGATVGGVVLQSLAALVGYVGGAASAVELSPKFISAPGATAARQLLVHSRAEPRASNASQRAVSRFASGAVLPVAVSGIFNLIPLLPMSFVLTFVGAAASVHSGWVGASAMLALEGQPRKRAAAVPAGLAVGLVLLATAARTVLPT